MNGPRRCSALNDVLPNPCVYRVYNIATGKIYATSNWAGSLDNPINVTTIDIKNDHKTESVRYDKLAEGNGGSAFYPPGTPANSSEGQQIVFSAPIAQKTSETAKLNDITKVFVPGGMYIFNAYKLWKITIKAEGRSVKRGFGLY
ncbi:hypothetical protein CLAFUW4_02910 [Fulvia fulva]|uniref:Uncharacterized protein n=1 Tax=Passalora fulva TaxID=5499 RepID=A0A9Q8P543_PASFU|nr:uncharacterized protein CLAFUR5_02897 [Fulvia fulva]KAK4631869.1 hypothetical protein CLAFUR4_02903 [Fulvia fulva]KAK4632437.1 hypothetical protein CLAFUR0_02906 [Fulvia fulva]UJO13618.1 hypothetical protein CLAFUR5_02897 [Fulvia fulva]WPV11377.1 hypothetical protein CLAFUW4_02910 [Fulvia fulva]WPV26231.1 hypothetical protein CLAFUW7_02907 [Fulvia fulva]